MSNNYLLVDDSRRMYLDCEKLLILGPGDLDGKIDGLYEQPFDEWLRVVNWGDDPPKKTDRYRLALYEAYVVYGFLTASGWKARIVSLDSDDYDTIEAEYHRVGTIWP
jgi:hypothetical protein